MNDLVEVRGTTVAYEMRNGVRIEYAADDRETRMRNLGCPEAIIKRMRSAKRSSALAKKPEVPTGPPSENILAAMNGLTLEAFRQRADFERKQRLVAAGRVIERQADADRRAKLAKLGKQIATDDTQYEKDSALLDRFQSLAGITQGRRQL